jgi:predicted nucleotidyltransferase
MVAEGLMVNALPDDLVDVLARLDRGLKDLYGGRYRGLILHGSYARDEADEGSDVDLLLLLEGEVESWHEYLRAEPLSWPLSLESGYVLSLFAVNVESYRDPRKPFLMNARKEGVSLG